MLASPHLGTITDVDIRQAWAHEAHSFTPWLAANLDVLSRVIGIPMELEGTEVTVESFFADILARNTLDDSLVLVEHDVEPTAWEAVLLAANWGAGVGLGFHFGHNAQQGHAWDYFGSVDGSDRWARAVGPRVVVAAVVGVAVWNTSGATGRWWPWRLGRGRLGDRRGIGGVGSTC